MMSETRLYHLAMMGEILTLSTSELRNKVSHFVKWAFLGADGTEDVGPYLGTVRNL